MLRVRVNGLAFLPASIGDLTGLKRLILSYNSLNKLPDSLSKLTSVTYYSYIGEPGLNLNNDKVETCPSKAILAKAGGFMSGNPRGTWQAWSCTGFTSTWRRGLGTNAIIGTTTRRATGSEGR